MKTDKKTLLRVKKLIPQIQNPDELLDISTITNMYIDFPTKDNKELLEIYCDMAEGIIELDNMEKKQKIR